MLRVDDSITCSSKVLQIINQWCILTVLSINREIGIMNKFKYDELGLFGERLDVSIMTGMTIVDVSGLTKDSDEVFFTTTCGRQFKMYHEQDCCESVNIDDVCGDVEDLIGAIIIHFEERISEGDEDSGDKPNQYSESFTWTFYDIQTDKGCVNIKWLGESNGYYSESVTLIEGDRVADET